MTKRPHILELGNHAEVLRLLKKMAGKSKFNWYHDNVRETGRSWFLLAAQHLRVAHRLDGQPRNWRAVVSRSYYAAYNVSRTVRYLVNGFVKFDASDHTIVGDLPKDFPQRALWSTFLVDLRKDRNIADYEPWAGVRATLSQEPRITLDKVKQFTKESKEYLRTKGIKI